MFCQDMDAEIYLSMYGNNKTMKPQKIKTFAAYQKFSENLKNDYFVIAANDTNEVSVSFNGRSDCKVFPFDKVLCTNLSQVELGDSLAKSIIQDIKLGLDCFLVVCDLAATLRPFCNKASFFELAFIQALIQNIIQELFIFTEADENMDSSLHISLFEVHGNKIVDLLNNSEIKDLKILEAPVQNSIEIEGIVEKPIVDESDIAELFTKQSLTSICYASMCHCFLNVSLIRKNITCDGFESIKVGKLTVVDFAKCNNNILQANIFEDYLLKTSQGSESPSRNKIFEIMKPAFGGNAKTSVIVTLSSVLFSPEKDISILQFVAQARKILNNPEVNQKLIIPSSLKEYSEEIQELQKDFSAISKGIGIKVETLKYRFLKNSITFENEKVKALNSCQLSLTDSINFKKQSLISIHTTTEQIEQEIKEVENSIENLKLDIKKVEEENNVKQKTSVIADEIIAMKELRDFYEFSIKKQKSELIKINRNYEGLICYLDSLKGYMLSLFYDIDAKRTTVNNTLDLLVSYMSNALFQFQTLHEDLLNKLNLCDIDTFIKSWKENVENLHSKLFSCIEEHYKHLDSMKLKMNSTMLALHETEIMEIIHNNRNEKWPLLLYYFHKVQVFCDSSFKTLAEIVCQLEVIQNDYKAELKTISSILFSSSKTLKKFVSDVSDALKMSQHYFEEQEHNLSQMADLVHFHHEFKKQFDNNFTDLKNSFLALKQMCLNYNSNAVSKWNEIEEDCTKIFQKNDDLSKNLCLITKKLSSYTENLSQQKLNKIGYLQLKDKIENVDSRTQQLLHVCKEMKAATEDASDLNKKGTDKESLEVKEYITSQKNDIEKHFNNYFSMMKASSSSFYENLKDIQNLISSSKEDLKNNLNFLSSTISSLTEIYNGYQSISCDIMEENEVLKFSSIFADTIEDNAPEYECVIFDEGQVSSSTPKVTEKRIINKEYEREKIFSRIKSIVEQKMTQNLNFSDFHSEGKERKNQNISTMSLPSLSTNLNTHTKACHAMEKNYKKIKFSKKQP